jgi:hypothetical protein
MSLSIDTRADLAEMVDIARSITAMLDAGGLSKDQRARLMADYADAHAEIDELLGLV